VLHEGHEALHGRNGVWPDAAPPDDSRHRGRRRSDRAHRAILDAARDLLADVGLAHLNLEQVAARAGVGKATIYRHWPTREALALELLLEIADEMVPTPRIGDTREELVAIVAGTMRALAETPMGRVLRSLLSELALNPAIGEPFRASVSPRWREEVANAIARAVHRGDIRPDADVSIATELLLGPIYYRLVFGGDISSDFADRVVDALLRGYGSGRAR
jgi:AcrR family transcriptional regulator